MLYHYVFNPLLHQELLCTFLCTLLLQVLSKLQREKIDRYKKDSRHQSLLPWKFPASQSLHSLQQVGSLILIGWQSKDWDFIM